MSFERDIVSFAVRILLIPLLLSSFSLQNKRNRLPDLPLQNTLDEARRNVEKDRGHKFDDEGPCKFLFPHRFNLQYSFCPALFVNEFADCARYCREENLGRANARTAREKSFASAIRF